MKVINIQIYRNRKIIHCLERKVGELALSQGIGNVKQIKYCFKEWLKISSKV